MKSRYFLRTVIHGTGEKSPMLFDRETGLPDRLANDWKIERRAVTRSHLTLRQELLAIAFFYDFAFERGVDIASSFASGRGMSSETIAALQESCWLNRRVPAKSREGTKTVVDRVRKFRVDVIRIFCVWSLNRTFESWSLDGLVERDRAAQIVYHIGRHDRQMRAFATETGGRRGLTDEQLVTLFDTVAPDSHDNPFQPRFRLRNYLIVVILYCFGLRRAELLLLLTADVDYRARRPSIWVRRLPDARGDLRDDIAVKTRERHIPLTDGFARIVRSYIRVVRAALPRATRTPFLFLGANGSPLGTDGFQHIFESIRKNRPELTGLSGHILRHTWADSVHARFERSVRDGLITRELAILTINYLGGWTPHSSMSAQYSRGYIEGCANDMYLEMMTANERRLSEAVTIAAALKRHEE